MKKSDEQVGDLDVLRALPIELSGIWLPERDSNPQPREYDSIIQYLSARQRNSEQVVAKGTLNWCAAGLRHTALLPWQDLNLRPPVTFG